MLRLNRHNCMAGPCSDGPPTSPLHVDLFKNTLPEGWTSSLYLLNVKGVWNYSWWNYIEIFHLQIPYSHHARHLLPAPRPRGKSANWESAITGGLSQSLFSRVYVCVYIYIYIYIVTGWISPRQRGSPDTASCGLLAARILIGFGCIVESTSL